MWLSPALAVPEALAENLVRPVESPAAPVVLAVPAASLPKHPISAIPS